ncbi:hypothetical protein D584_24340 [Brucella intermedia M86]|uniref:Uncharacterized protein n=1 Tax=Brucella intermedia M86 TaxID=1234597 RepID=M5JTU6_9HYPH|nr:hypothetical protein D584_24340 [Brucella intermedia M86]
MKVERIIQNVTCPRRRMVGACMMHVAWKWHENKVSMLLDGRANGLPYYGAEKVFIRNGQVSKNTITIVFQS